LATVLLALGLAGWLWWRGADARWAETEALEEITSLIETGDLYEAYRIAREAERHRPSDPELERLVDRITLPVTVNTEPDGADVLVKGYATPDARWERIGSTPLTFRVPYAMMRWRITKAGYEAYEGAPFGGGSLGALARGVVLDAIGTRPPGTVRIPGGSINALPGVGPLIDQPRIEIPPFYLDRFEVTNREYRDFVLAGAYQHREWWPETIERAGVRIAWRDAIDEFRDATGQPGPSTWELGTFPEGEDEFPVSGISWYEATAYCAYAGKSLPTLFNWFSAIGQDQLSDILLHSNMDGTAKAPVGQFRGLGAYGTYDMAGNVKEWVSNAAGDLRYILGGSWNEPTYVFRHRVAQDPWERAPTYGVRCAQFPAPLAELLLAPIDPPRAYPRPKRLGNEAFAVLRGLYEYDRDSLDARVERVNDSLPNYRRETVSIRTAYGNERMEVHLLFPREGTPPYQSVLWFPGADAFARRTSDVFASEYLFDFLPRGGRVVVHPVYDGMYERFEERPNSPNDRRDLTIRRAKDIMRTIDYLETRPDFDATKIAYYGFSGGAISGPVFTAVEPRLRASILLGGGLIPRPSRPEVDPAQFAQQAQTPTLMINGRDDFLLPYDESQLPFFERLGAPEDMKRLARLEGGHIPTNRLEIVREVLDWLDLHLGSVQRSAEASSSAKQR
jgi:predicted esterase